MQTSHFYNFLRRELELNGPQRHTETVPSQVNHVSKADFMVENFSRILCRKWISLSTFTGLESLSSF